MKDYELKRKALIMFGEGSDFEEVVEELGANEEKVQEWLDEYNLEMEIQQMNGDPETLNGLLDAIKKRNELKKEELDLYKAEKENEQLKLKRSKLIYYKKLFTFLKNHCKGFKWAYTEVILFIKKLKTLQVQIEDITGHNPEEFEILFIWNRTRDLIDHLEELVSDFEEGDTIKFKFDENDVLFLEESLDTNSFDDEIEQETEEEQELDGFLEEEFSPQRV